MIDPAIRRPEDDEASLPTVVAPPVFHVPEPTNLTKALTPTHITSTAPSLLPEYRENSPAPNEDTAGWVPPTIPGYEIEAVLGRGGMGIVYRARQTKLNRIVALKMILAGEHAGHEASVRFLSEAETVAKLRHPNIVQIYSFGDHDETALSRARIPGGGQPVAKAGRHALAARTVPPR